MSSVSVGWAFSLLLKRNCLEAFLVVFLFEEPATGVSVDNPFSDPD